MPKHVKAPTPEPVSRGTKRMVASGKSIGNNGITLTDAELMEMKRNIESGKRIKVDVNEFPDKRDRWHLLRDLSYSIVRKRNVEKENEDLTTILLVTAGLLLLSLMVNFILIVVLVLWR